MKMNRELLSGVDHSPPHLRVDAESLIQLCRRYGVKRLALFGSVLGPRFNVHSDVDVLVEFEAGRTPGFGFAQLQQELSDLFGRDVDLHTYRSLSRYFRDEVAAMAQPLYDASAGDLGEADLPALLPRLESILGEPASEP